MDDFFKYREQESGFTDNQYILVHDPYITDTVKVKIQALVGEGGGGTPTLLEYSSETIYNNVQVTDSQTIISSDNFIESTEIRLEPNKATIIRNGFEAQLPIYKSYVALLTQSGTDAPVATVLENSIGTLNWSRYGVGSYILATDNEDLFPLGKTVILTNSGMDVFVAQAERDSDQGVALFTSDESWAGMDNFNTLYIEIRVYP